MSVFDPTAKKKKKRSKRAERTKRLKEDSIVDIPSTNSPSTTNEYSYGEMLSRLYTTMHSSLGSSMNERSNIKIPPVKCYQAGVRKTLWVNFEQFCQVVNRTHEHVYTYLEIELGTATSVDMDKRLVIKAKFYPKEVISVVKKYLNEYVVCKICGCRETKLERENRITFLKCCSKACGSQRSVDTLNKGYTHQIKRK